MQQKTLLQQLQQQYTCPISQYPIRNPAVTFDGHSYQQHQIMKWFGSNNIKSPITGQDLKNLSIATNFTLKNVIDKINEKVPPIMSEMKTLKLQNKYHLNKVKNLQKDLNQTQNILLQFYEAINSQPKIMEKFREQNDDSQNPQNIKSNIKSNPFSKLLNYQNTLQRKIENRKKIKQSQTQKTITNIIQQRQNNLNKLKPKPKPFFDLTKLLAGILIVIFIAQVYQYHQNQSLNPTKYKTFTQKPHKNDKISTNQIPNKVNPQKNIKNTQKKLDQMTQAKLLLQNELNFKNLDFMPKRKYRKQVFKSEEQNPTPLQSNQNQKIQNQTETPPNDYARQINPKLNVEFMPKRSNKNKKNNQQNNL